MLVITGQICPEAASKDELGASRSEEFRCFIGLMTKSVPLSPVVTEISVSPLIALGAPPLAAS